MKRIGLSVRDFAVPVPRVGSIEVHSGYGKVPVDGQEVHRRVQRGREKAHPTYEAEVLLSAAFEREEFRFEVSGRLDGIFRADTPLIEEIKSAFSLKDLERKLGEESHPYHLQLRTYGYFYWLEHRVEPALSFHLVSTRNWKTRDLGIAFDVENYERWLELRLSELVEEARRAEERTKRRVKVAGKFVFPFDPPRDGQVELISTVEKGMEEGARMLFQAPTGLGKTAGVLYPVLKEALARGQRVIYVTPKNSQHAVAEDAVDRFQDKGAKVRSLTITAKSKMCFKAEPLCNPQYCEFAKDYYQKVDAAKIQDLLAKKRKLTAKVFKNVGEAYQVCPFELQLEAAQSADVVICDYNYVFAPRSAFGRIALNSLGQSGKPNLIIDEAHNLFSRAQGYYSPELSTVTLERMRQAVRNLPLPYSMEAERLLNACLTSVAACRPQGAEKAVEIDPPREVFLEQDAELRSFLSRYLESDVEIQPRDVVMRLCFYWSEFTSALDFVTVPKRPEFFTTFRPLPFNGGIIKITCCDAAEMLKEGYDEFQHIVGFSATLKPFEYYAKLSGLTLEGLKVAEFYSPFPKQHRKLLIIKEISTKFSERERNYRKIAETVQRVSALRAGNYFAFFPSFDFLEQVHQRFTPPPGFSVVRQEKEMNATAIDVILERLRRQEPTIVFAVQGGVFSEGVDYPGDMLIGAFVVGPPLPTFDLEREKMRAYYEKVYGAGFDYAYSFPAMAKAVQAAGRVVRSETDRGVIILMDNRFLADGYSKSMPQDWFADSPLELTSRSILKDIQDFWDS